DLCVRSKFLQSTQKFTPSEYKNHRERRKTMGLNVKNHAVGPGRPKGFTHSSARRRQDECYRLYLMGLNMTEIAESLRIDRSSVSRYIQKSLQKGTWSNKTYREKFNALSQQTLDQIM